METFSEYLRNRQTPESEVYNLLSGCLSDKENIINEEDSKTKFRFDFKLPQGLKKLSYPLNTHIEVKFRLSRITISRIRYVFDQIKPAKLIVVVYEGFDLSLNDSCNNIAKDVPIEIISFETLRRIVQNTMCSENVIEGRNKYDLEQNVIENLKNKVKNDRLSIFIGAGVSASAGVPTWQTLLEMLCVKNKMLKIDSDIDEITKARFIIEEKYKENGKIKDQFYSDMKDCLYKNTHKSNLLSSISTLVQKYNVESIITYNYDSLLEEEINNGNKKCESIYDKTRTFDLPVYHVHGYIPNSGFHSEVVLGESEYHKIYQEAYNWGNVEQLHALCRNTCLFIGLSMKDPNLRRLIDISLEGSDVEPIHFVFLRRIEYNILFMEKTMRSFGINCVWYDEFSDLPKLLDDLCK